LRNTFAVAILVFASAVNDFNYRQLSSQSSAKYYNAIGFGGAGIAGAHRRVANSPSDKKTRCYIFNYAKFIPPNIFRLVLFARTFCAVI
jgi:hypothetical protein